jgi:hypothetical protein
MGLKYTEKKLEKIFGEFEDDEIEQATGSSDYSFSIRNGLSYLEQEIHKVQRATERAEQKFEKEREKLFDPKHYKLKINNSYLDSLEDLLGFYSIGSIKGASDSLYSYKSDDWPDKLVSIHQELEEQIGPLEEKIQGILDRYLLVKDEAELKHQQADALSTREKISIKHSQIKEGFLYILENDSIPEILKIGFTSRPPDVRAKEINQKTDIPGTFSVSWYKRTIDPYIVEQRVIDALSEHHLGREIFRCGIELAKNCVENEIEKLTKM